MEVGLFGSINVIAFCCNRSLIFQIWVPYDCIINNIVILLSNCSRTFALVLIYFIFLSLDKVSLHVTRLGSSFANIAIEKSTQINKGLIWFFGCLTISFLGFFISLSYVPFWTFHRVNFFYMADLEIIVVEKYTKLRFLY